VPLKTTTARKPTSCLSRQNCSQTQRLVSGIFASQDNNGSQANFMPLKTNKRSQTQWLVSQVYRYPNPSTTASIRCTQANILNYTQPVCVFSVSRCAFCLDHTKPKDLRRFPPNATPHFESPELFPWSSSFPVSWLLPDPGSFAFPSLARFLALADPPGPLLPSVGGAAYGGRRRRCGGERKEGGRRCGLRRAAQEVGRRRMEDG
jgi:hypothetical protein